MRVAGCVAVGLGERKRDTQIGSGSPGTVQIYVAAERLYSILDAEQPGAAGEFGTSPAVVGDLEAQSAVGPISFDGHRDRRGPGVLGRVGQCFGDDVVGADLNLIGQPFVDAQLELNRNWRAAGHLAQR